MNKNTYDMILCGKVVWNRKYNILQHWIKLKNKILIADNEKHSDRLYYSRIPFAATFL